MEQSTYYCHRSKTGRRIYFRARWIKRRKNYRIWWIYPRCEDVLVRKIQAFSRSDGLTPEASLVSESKTLKVRPSDQTLSRAWDISKWK